MNIIQQLKQIYKDYQTYELTLEQAKNTSQPLLNTLNGKGAKVASSYNKRFKPLTFNDIPKLRIVI